ncbi:hypothetical protein ES703_79229 [subsurface metagenome]
MNVRTADTMLKPSSLLTLWPKNKGIWGYLQVNKKSIGCIFERLLPDFVLGSDIRRNFIRKREAGVELFIRKNLSRSFPIRFELNELFDKQYDIFA